MIQGVVVNSLVESSGIDQTLFVTCRSECNSDTAPRVNCVSGITPNGFDPNKDSKKISITFAQEGDGEKVDLGWKKISTGIHSAHTYLSVEMIDWSDY
jgi:hypothetical protein